MPSRRIIFCSEEHTSMCHLDISRTSESLTAADEITHKKLQIMFGSAWTRIPADTSTKTKKAQEHSTSESWPNSLDPQRFHTERSLVNWKNLSYRRQRHTADMPVRSQDKNRNFHNSSNSLGTNRSRRTPSPRRRRLRRRWRRKGSKNPYTMIKTTTQQLDTTTNTLPKTAFVWTLQHFIFNFFLMFWTQQTPPPH